MMTTTHIAIIEDDTEIARLTTLLLESEGYVTSQVHHGDDAVQHIRQQNPALVILDVMLPGKNGIQICQEIRSFYSGPVLMLTGADDDITEISAFKQGADDYLTKPIRPHVLLLRIAALLRRSTIQSPEKQQEEIINNGPMTLYVSRREVEAGGINLPLSAAEFDLLLVLARNLGSPVSRDHCCEALRGLSYDGFDRSIDMRVSSLRKKLNDAQSPHRFIKTVRGKGYMLAKLTAGELSQ